VFIFLDAVNPPDYMVTVRDYFFAPVMTKPRLFLSPRRISRSSLAKCSVQRAGRRIRSSMCTKYLTDLSRNVPRACVTPCVCALRGTVGGRLTELIDVNWSRNWPFLALARGVENHARRIGPGRIKGLAGVRERANESGRERERKKRYSFDYGCPGPQRRWRVAKIIRFSSSLPRVADKLGRARALRVRRPREVRWRGGALPQWRVNRRRSPGGIMPRRNVKFILSLPSVQRRMDSLSLSRDTTIISMRLFRKNRDFRRLRYLVGHASVLFTLNFWYF